MGSGVAAVIGAAQGIGEATATFLAQGERVSRLVLADRQQEKVTDVARRLSSRNVEVIGCFVDIAEQESVDELVAQAGPVDQLAIVAGIVGGTGTMTVTPEQFSEVLRVNTVGVYMTARAFAMPMIARGGGSIVAVSSAAGRFPRRNLPAYCASKAALVTSLRVLAMETVPRGVRINVVSPGATETRMQGYGGGPRDPGQVAGDLSRERLPILDGRVAKLSEIANAIAFLLGPESNHIALRDLVIDGGELLGV